MGNAILSAPKRSLLTIGRRGVLVGGAAGLVSAPAFLKGARATPATLFSLGVASGDPRATSAVLWTRLAPDPLNGGGMGSANVQVLWEVATDEGMTNVIAGGAVVAKAVDGHTVHVVAGNLPSNSWFYYRFTAQGESSRIGRTRTLPQSGDRLNSPLRFASVSCQDFTAGYYKVYADIAQQNLDFVLHVGDYIYEGGADANPIFADRNHRGGEIFTIADYRNRYALYKLDTHLQDAHARFPFIVTFDDHEVDNNYAGTNAEEGAPYQGADFLQRRRNAYKVYSEMMPLRGENQFKPANNSMTLYRQLKFGQLANIFVLDTRQFRSDQPAGDNFGSTDPDSVVLEPAFSETLYDATGINNPAATMMGATQEAWLANGLKNSRSEWNVVAQQVMMMPWNLVRTAALNIQFNPAIPPALKQQLLQAASLVSNVYNVDAWDGYPAARARFLQMLQTLKPSNPIVLSGDIHSAWASNLLSDFSNPQSQVLAAEFTCTSVTSTFLTQNPKPTEGIVRPGVQQDNKHIAFFNGLFRGYCLHDVDYRRWQTTYRAVGTLADLAAASSTNAADLTLTPRETSAVETDAVVEIQNGFAIPNSGKRLEVKSARIPL
jgi:alkaline phosphatase D